MAWQVDKSHTHINFIARHMMISKVRGEFQDYDIDIQFDADQPVVTAVDVRIEANSINTRDEKRDAHLRSPDFLNADGPDLQEQAGGADRPEARPSDRRPDHP